MKDLDYRIYCVIIAVIGLVVIFFLTGCENRKCIESHEETSTCVRYFSVYNGRAVSMIPNYYKCTKTICDKWEENE